MIDILKELGGLAILAAALAWVIRSIVSHSLSLDVEKYKSNLSLQVEAYKSDLAQELTKSIEGFKAQLQLAAKEHDVRFTKLHEKRVETLAELHTLLTDAFHQMLQSEDGSGPDSAEKVSEACGAASTFFGKRKLYLSSGLANTVQTFILKVNRTSRAFWEDVDPYCSGSLDEWREMRREVPKILEQIESEFRSLLGSDIVVIAEPEDTPENGKGI